MSKDAALEVAALWRATFGEEVAIAAEPGVTLQVLVRCLPKAGPWVMGQLSAAPYFRTAATLASNNDQSSSASIPDQMASTSPMSISCGSDAENTVS